MTGGCISRSWLRWDRQLNDVVIHNQACCVCLRPDGTGAKLYIAPPAYIALTLEKKRLRLSASMLWEAQYKTGLPRCIEMTTSMMALQAQACLQVTLTHNESVTTVFRSRREKAKTTLWAVLSLMLTVTAVRIRTWIAGPDAGYHSINLLGRASNRMETPQMCVRVSRWKTPTMQR